MIRSWRWWLLTAVIAAAFGFLGARLGMQHAQPPGAAGQLPGFAFYEAGDEQKLERRQNLVRGVGGKQPGRNPRLGQKGCAARQGRALACQAGL